MTGATGFIGAAVARLLAEHGWQIRALTRKSSTLDRLGTTSVERVMGSLEDESALRNLLTGVQAVVHCAGAVRGASRADFDQVNVAGLLSLVRAAAAQRPRPRFLSLSSLAAREPGLSHYAASKRAGELALVSAAGAVPWTVLRPPAVYGPGDRELLPLFRLMRWGLAPVPGNGRARFSLMFVDDLASAVLDWLESGGGGKAVMELHDGKQGGYSWHDVIRAAGNLRGRAPVRLPVPVPALRLAGYVGLGAARLAGYAPMLTPGKVSELIHPDWVCDNRQVFLQLGWRPRFELEAGLRRTLDWPVGAPR
ncbi:MAG: SDR family NAD(P)-dependent oxidoreductase [Gammaproteobacteria bacterium]|nr:SDR family NAD(P)-dependent oxidoreductase [Gammaproteobacteria bacterium]